MCFCLGLAKVPTFLKSFCKMVNHFWRQGSYSFFINSSLISHCLITFNKLGKVLKRKDKNKISLWCLSLHKYIFPFLHFDLYHPSFTSANIYIRMGIKAPFYSFIVLLVELFLSDAFSVPAWTVAQGPMKRTAKWEEILFVKKEI